WEPAADAHDTVPAILHTATGDVYLDVEAVHAAPGSPCVANPSGAWFEAHVTGSPSRICPGSTLDAVRMRAVALPGVSLLWLALLLFVVHMALRMGPTAEPLGARQASA